MTTAVAPPAPRRRFKLRYSLRVLLAAFTGFAIGFPIWYRWPYTEEEPQYPTRRGQPDKTQPAIGKLVITWQRQWGGGRLKHGPEWTYRGGKRFVRATYRNGILHGPFKRGDRAASFFQEGEYVNGKRHGPWRSVNAGYCTEVVHYRDDMKNGLFERVSPKGVIWEKGQYEDDLPMGEWIAFDGSGVERGRAIHRGDAEHRTCEFIGDGVPIVVVFDERAIPKEVQIDGRVLEDRLGRRVALGVIQDQRIVPALSGPTDVEFVNVPPHDVFEFIAAKHEIPMICDRHVAEQGKGITAKLFSLPLSSVMAILADRGQLACDYRYGILWITSAADGQNWKDSTGVADVVPPKGSQLARSWNAPVDATAMNQPLADVIELQLIRRLAIAVDVTQIRSIDEKEPTYLVTSPVKGIRFKDALGILLDQARCRCKLRGETLLILPQEAPVAEESQQE